LKNNFKERERMKKHKCMWCNEEYINELVLQKKDACICFGCVMSLAATTVQYIQHNTMDLREIEKKIIESQKKDENNNTTENTES